MQVFHKLMKRSGYMAGLPVEVTELLSQVQLYSGGVVVGLSGCMVMVAGLMRTVGLREEGKARYKDALMGLAMVITGPTVIMLIATILKAFFPTTTAGGAF